MPTIDGGMARYDINDPADAQVLVDNGFAWKGGPKTLKVLFDLITSGAVKRNPAKETPEVTAYLDKVAPLSGVNPSQPVEPPVA